MKKLIIRRILPGADLRLWDRVSTVSPKTGNDEIYGVIKSMHGVNGISYAIIAWDDQTKTIALLSDIQRNVDTQQPEKVGD